MMNWLFVIRCWLFVLSAWEGSWDSFPYHEPSVTLFLLTLIIAHFRLSTILIPGS